MKKGFTLLELIVVIVIIGILATLGFAQYSRMIERSRGAEARAVAGSIRTQAAGFHLENATLTPAAGSFDDSRAGIGTATDQIPSACRGTHYFSYAVSGVAADSFTLTATRCTAGGKNPNASTALTLTLTSNLATGTDTWGGTGGY